MSARRELLELLRLHAVQHGEFVLSSGERSAYYLDARLVTLSSAGSRLVGRLLCDYLAADPPEAVAGMSIGADPLVSSVTVTSALDGRGIDGLLVRKFTKGHGTGRLVEGPVRPGLRVVVVEDTATTGASLIAAVDAVRAAGCVVERTLALIDRQQGAAERVRGAGYGFDAIFRVAEVLDAGTSS